MPGRRNKLDGLIDCLFVCLLACLLVLFCFVLFFFCYALALGKNIYIHLQNLQYLSQRASFVSRLFDAIPRVYEHYVTVKQVAFLS